MSSFVRLPATLLGPLAAGVAFYAAAAGALMLTAGENGIAAVWPANGILLAALMIAPPRTAWRYALAATLASAAANAGSGVGPLATLGYTAANIGEALLAWRLLIGRRAIGRRHALPSFVAVPEVARFFLAAFVAALASATLAVLFDLTQAPAAWSSWVTTDLLGMLIVVPTIVTGRAFLRQRRDTPWRAAAEAAILLAGVSLVATLAFVLRVPLLFLPTVALLLATLRFGPFGAAVSVAVIAGIGSAFTGIGYGPLWRAVEGGAAMRVLFFQFYLLVMLATGLPLGALLAAHDGLVRRLAERNRLLHLAERSAGLGHWWLGAHGEGHYFSPEVARIHDLATASPTLAELLAGYGADDRTRVEAAVARALCDGTPFDHEARLVTAAGEQRRIHATGTADRDADGALVGVFGTFQDVTRQVEGQHALEAARVAAEQAARLATAAAETDALTGVANRRKIAELLDDMIATAEAAAQPLSVAILDLDHFKAINDHFGHLVGDRVLMRVARTAAASLRGGDVVGRMGGEEFILLLPAAGSDAAAAIAERVRLAIAAAEPGTEPLPATTASIGVATLRTGEGAPALLHRADCALYDAKRAGRNALRHAA